MPYRDKDKTDVNFPLIMNVQLFIPDELFDQIRTIAIRRNMTVNEVLIEALEYYVEVSKYS
ncbi:MAG: hypothetical protein ASUL_02749 [Candidatus Aramenus sulfurataquae]|uniref:Uncharacterized protein n=3 Tax=Candidatus Aramenus sulfurataquae TaxID=1326980 RepID=W7KYT0_9CREN|nr:MAG: hypothetical protein ASUL_02749 [Candidatus Aramenus sulfurataquae]